MIKVFFVRNLFGFGRKTETYGFAQRTEPYCRAVAVALVVMDRPRHSIPKYRQSGFRNFDVYFKEYPSRRRRSWEAAIEAKFPLTLIHYVLFDYLFTLMKVSQLSKYLDGPTTGKGIQSCCQY
jgi:hypothetical protein